MHIRIYFKNKPLFLADSMDAEIEPFTHHDDTVLIDEFSQPALNSLIHELKEDRIHAAIFLHDDLQLLKKAFFKKFILIEAAGGLVQNEKKEWLFIHRRGRWDLPKGKKDEGETSAVCAVREVEEETGLNSVSIVNPLVTTYHCYEEFGKSILKETDWFLMEASSAMSLNPQTEEDIVDLRWVAAVDLSAYFANTFPAIQDVLTAAGYQNR